MRITDTHYFFWHHEFGQWTKRAMQDFTGNVYNCAEQYMMYQKALLFNEPETAERILEEHDPRTQQSLGRQIKNFDQKTWERWRFQIVCTGNLLKFTQHSDLRARLVSTYPKILVEASPCDRIWGVGLSAADDRILDEDEWVGENLFGSCLMAVRSVLMKEDKDDFSEFYTRMNTPLPQCGSD